MENKLKKIWLINQYAMPPQYESRLRTIKFAHYLTQKGYEVTIFASSALHNMNINLISGNDLWLDTKYDDIHFIHIKAINYKKTLGIRRIISTIQFNYRLLKVIKRFSNPDIIIHTPVVPFVHAICSYSQKIKAEYIAEVLDLWPQQLVDFGILKSANPLMKYLYKKEKWLYFHADKLVFSFEGGKKYLIDKKWDISNGGVINLDKVHYINNGVDLIDFNKYKEEFILEDVHLQNVALKKIVYVGSIRLANDVKYLIDAAKYLIDYKDIVFLIYGNGDYREPLETYCRENGIANVIFKQKWIEPHFVPYLLSKSTVNILNYKSGNFGKYGGSQSKLFQYLASGKPICSNLKMMYCLINKYNLGIAKEFSSNEEYANAILFLANLDQVSYNEMCERSQKVAKEFDYRILTERLTEIF